MITVFLHQTVSPHGWFKFASFHSNNNMRTWLILYWERKPILMFAVLIFSTDTQSHFRHMCRVYSYNYKQLTLQYDPDKQSLVRSLYTGGVRDGISLDCFYLSPTSSFSKTKILDHHLQLQYYNQRPAVRKPMNANPRLRFNRGFHLVRWKCVFFYKLILISSYRNVNFKSEGQTQFGNIFSHL